MTPGSKKSKESLKGVKMIINRLNIENFRVFYGENSFKPTGRVSIIIGKNGYGKSTIMDAIFWALFGKVQNRGALVNPNPLDLINTFASKKNLGCRVEINFTHNDTKVFVKRVLDKNLKEKVFVEIDGKRCGTDEFLEIFPESLSILYLLNGETISEYAMGKKDIKGAIEISLNLPKIIKTQEILKKILEKKMGEYLETVKKEGERRKEIKKLLTNIEKKKKGLGELRKQLKESEKRFDKKNKKLEKLSKKEKNFQRLFEVERGLEKIIEREERLEKELLRLQKETKAFLGELGFLIIRDDFYDLLEDFRERKKNIQLLRIKQGRFEAQLEILNEILETKSCLCGTRLSTTDYGKREIRRFKRELERNMTKVSREAERLESFDVPSTDIEKGADFIKALRFELYDGERLSQKIKEIFLILKEIKEIKEELEREEKIIKDSLKDSLKDGRKNIREKIENLRMEIGEERERIRNNFERIKTIDVQIKEIFISLESERIGKQTQRFLRITKKLKVNLALFEELIYLKSVERIDSIEKESSRIFLKLTNKPEEFRGIILERENFLVKVCGKDGSFSIEKLSEGERMIVALSILAAIKNSLDRTLFLIDNPFMRLDKTHHRNLLENIGTISEQIILLASDKELPSNEVKEMEDVDLYKLTHNEDDRYSILKEVEFD